MCGLPVSCFTVSCCLSVCVCVWGGGWRGGGGGCVCGGVGVCVCARVCERTEDVLWLDGRRVVWGKRVVLVVGRVIKKKRTTGSARAHRRTTST